MELIKTIKKWKVGQPKTDTPVKIMLYRVNLSTIYGIAKYMIISTSTRKRLYFLTRKDALRKLDNIIRNGTRDNIFQLNMNIGSSNKVVLYINRYRDI